MTVVGMASNSAEALRQARPAAGFLVKPELSARAISRILGRTP